MKMLLVFCLLVTACGRQALALSTTPMVQALAGTSPSKAHACDSLRLANSMVRGCDDGRNVSDVCCSFVFSAVGRGSDCFCQVRSQSIYIFSVLERRGAMGALLRACHADPYMIAMTSKPCGSHADAPTPAAAVAPSASDDEAADNAAPAPAPPTAISCSGHTTALVIGWVSAGVLLILLLLSLVRSAIMRRRCPWCHLGEEADMMELAEFAPRLPHDDTMRVNERNVGSLALALERMTLADDEIESDPLISSAGDSVPLIRKSATTFADDADDEIESDPLIPSAGDSVPLIRKSATTLADDADDEIESDPLIPSATGAAALMTLVDEAIDSVTLIPDGSSTSAGSSKATSASATFQAGEELASVPLDAISVSEKEQRTRRFNPKYADFVCTWPGGKL